MAQPATNPKIEELRFRLKTDPKNRIFYPLAEELRKAGQFTEAEQVLRGGLTNHPSYLSAWVCLGRVLRELKNDGAAADALNKALQLDPGNVVAARLLAETYLSMGEKVEAIKKYKLVYALLPADQEVEAIIERLDRELNPPAPVPALAEAALPVVESPFAPEPESAAAESPFAAETELVEAPLRAIPPEVAISADLESPFAPQPSVLADQTATFPPGRRMVNPPSAALRPETVPEAEVHTKEPAGPWATDEAHVFAGPAESMQQDLEREQATGDSEPMAAAHAESPFEEPTSYGAAAFEIESPQGMHIAQAPLAAEQPVELPVSEHQFAETAAAPAAEEADVFAPVSEPQAGTTREEPIAAAAAEEEITNTLTMADLYAKQGLIADARQIYENILQRDPGNAVVRQKLSELVAPEGPAAHDDRVAKLEGWLARVGKREAGSV